MSRSKDVEHGLIVWARVDAVVSLILQNPRYIKAQRSGELTRVVIDHFKKEKVNITDRTAQRYVKEAKAEIRRISKAKLQEKISKAVFARLSLIERCRTAKDFKTELATMKDIAELEGLYPEKNLNIKGELVNKNIDYAKLTKRQLQRLAAGEDINSVLSDAAD